MKVVKTFSIANKMINKMSTFCSLFTRRGKGAMFIFQSRFPQQFVIHFLQMAIRLKFGKNTKPL